jgi:uncharacterized membrane protein
MDIHERIAFLEENLRKLALNHDQLRNELLMIQMELQELKPKVEKDVKTFPAAVPLPTTPSADVAEKSEIWIPKRPSASPKPWQRRFSGNKIEDLVGTNIINKVGIFVTVIGVFIGAKYAIDRDLISPAMRIILGYAIAAVLFAFAYRLKPRYHNYSAVLMSGAVSIAYFITLIAYSFYQLMPQALAFSLMLLITVSVVWMAIWYDRKIIALLGQVGGYAIPFFLSGGYNTAEQLAYLTIINTGLLYLSFRKDWKDIYYLAFSLSWIIFIFDLPWSNSKTFFWRDTLFLTLNFSIFYAAFLGYKIIKKENYKFLEIVILLANAYFYYLLGYKSINNTFQINSYLIIFTLSNAAVHFMVAAWVHRIKLIDNSVFLFILGLAISFATIAVPIGFNGNTTTVFWAIEACVLTYIGYRTDKGYYINLALAVLFLTVVSLSDDWGRSYDLSGSDPSFTTTPFLNANFWSSIFVIGCLGIISYMAIRNRDRISNSSNEILYKAVPFAFIGFLYLVLNLEISKWSLQYFGITLSVHAGQMTTIVLLIYSLIYISSWLYLNIRYFKNKELALVMTIIGGLLLLSLLTGGLNTIGELRRNYLADRSGSANLLMGNRYVLIALTGLMMYGIRENMKLSLAPLLSSRIYFYLLNTVLLTFVCNEFIHWMDLGGYPNQYKLGLSIIGGLYALALVAAGIRKRQKHFRVTGIFLLSCTLAKVLFYDLASLSTVSKTIVLIILGAIMLAASFLYNKYKEKIFSDTDSGKIFPEHQK